MEIFSFPVKCDFLLKTKKRTKNYLRGITVPNLINNHLLMPGSVGTCYKTLVFTLPLEVMPENLCVIDE